MKNRSRAIHGTRCKACGFDFNEFYGEELANSFIEIHHTIQLSDLYDGRFIDPIHDMIPLCSNCHSMIHRRRVKLLTVEELIKIIDNNKKRFQYS